MGLMEVVIALMRSASCGDRESFIVADHIFREPPDSEEVYPPFSLLDAITNYDVYRSMGVYGYAAQEGVEKH
jgi:hypothetical protein